MGVQSKRWRAKLYSKYFFFIRKKIFFICMNVLLTYICTMCMPGVQGGQKKTSEPLELKLGTWWASIKVLRFKPRSPARTDAVNCWVISSCFTEFLRRPSISLSGSLLWNNSSYMCHMFFRFFITEHFVFQGEETLIASILSTYFNSYHFESLKIK